MATKLTKEIKREVDIGEEVYTVTLSPAGLKIVLKGKRKGYEITWSDLVTGTVELDIRLRQSLKSTQPPADPKAPPR